jgi:hypothetical protein
MPADLPRFDAGMLARPAMPIRAADATGMHFENNAILGAFRISDLFNRQILVVFSQNGCAHGLLPTKFNFAPIEGMRVAGSSGLRAGG